MPFSAAILLLVPAGCGQQPVPAATEAVSITPVADAGEDQPQPRGAGAITAIDAASGDAQAMPADSMAPSPYDLALRAKRARDADARAEPAEPARLDAPTDLTGGDEAVTVGG